MVIRIYKPNTPGTRNRGVSSFNEITKKAILDSIDKPRKLSLDLIHAQFARRSIDYLFGMNISPLLWGIVSEKDQLDRAQRSEACISSRISAVRN